MSFMSIPMTLQQAKRDIRWFIRQYWSDQKLAEVYAFNTDGKMSWLDSCGCIRGVTLSETLHSQPCLAEEDHYSLTGAFPGARIAEAAYLRLHFYECDDILRRERVSLVKQRSALAQRRLSAILRAELRRRARSAREFAMPGNARPACSILWRPSYEVVR
jgi:hypothetical protein